MLKPVRHKSLPVDGSGSDKVAVSMTGRQLWQMISAELPSKPGSHISLQHGSSPLSLDETLKQQGIVGESVTLSYVYVPADLLAAWKYLQGEQVDEEFSLHGLTRIGGIESAQQLLHLPSSLQHLELGDLNEGLLGVNFLPSGIKTITFRVDFNQSLDGVTLPAGLQTLTFGWRFNQSLDGVTLPASLQTLTFG